LLIHSEEFDNAAWVKYATTVSANTTTAPNGTATADKLVSNNTTNRFCVYRYLTMTANSVQTLSCYGKSAGWNFMTLSVGKIGSPYTRDSYTIDLSDGTVNKGPWTSNSVLFTAVTKEKLTNGWWKLSVSVKVDASSTDLHVEIGASPTNQYNNGMTGDGTSGIYIWGAQLEVGSFPTSYIPTTSSTVTRSADVASMTGTNFSSWFNQSEGTFTNHIIALKGAEDRGNVDYGAWVGASNTTTRIRSEYAGLGIAMAGQVYPTNPAPGVINAEGSTVVTATPAIDRKSAFAYDYYSVDFVFNGVLGTRDSSNPAVGTITDADRMYLTGFAGNNGLNKYISRISYYPTRLSNDQLQALTL
jgi:hypothetical protein